LSCSSSITPSHQLQTDKELDVPLTLSRGAAAEDAGDEEAMTRRDWLIAAALVSLVALTVAYRVTSKDAVAWVLWEKRMMFKDDGEATAWEPLDGFDRLADCQKSGQEILRTSLDFMRSGGRKLLSVRPDGRSAAYEATDGGAKTTIDTRYLCFPGQFDPRAPKT
jgi:hypothetical protein